MSLPIGLPALPLPGNEEEPGADLTISLRRDGLGRWAADMLNECGDLVDVFQPYDAADEALYAASDSYPGAVFIPPDMEDE